MSKNVGSQFFLHDQNFCRILCQASLKYTVFVIVLRFFMLIHSKSLFLQQAKTTY